MAWHGPCVENRDLTIMSDTPKSNPRAKPETAEDLAKELEKTRRDLKASQNAQSTLHEELARANERLEAQAAITKMLVAAAGGTIQVPRELVNDAGQHHKRTLLRSQWRQADDLLEYSLTERKKKA